MIEVNVVKSLPDNKVLIAENKQNKKNTKTRYYVLNEENADKFIKRRKNLENSDVFQRFATTSLAIVTGVYVAVKMNTNKFIRALTGLTTFAGVTAGFNKIDNYIDKMGQDNLKKGCEVEEITGNEERIAEALSYIPDDKE